MNKISKLARYTSTIPALIMGAIAFVVASIAALPPIIIFYTFLCTYFVAKAIYGRISEGSYSEANVQLNGFLSVCARNIFFRYEPGTLKISRLHHLALFVLSVPFLTLHIIASQTLLIGLYCSLISFEETKNLLSPSATPLSKKAECINKASTFTENAPQKEDGCKALSEVKSGKPMLNMALAQTQVFDGQDDQQIGSGSITPAVETGAKMQSTKQNRSING